MQELLVGQVSGLATLWVVLYFLYKALKIIFDKLIESYESRIRALELGQAQLIEENKDCRQKYDRLFDIVARLDVHDKDTHPQGAA